MKDWILENIFSIITAIFGGTSFIGYLKERKHAKSVEEKYTLENKSLEADALKSMREMYAIFVEDSNNKYKEIQEELSDLKESLKKREELFKKEQDKYFILKSNYVSLKENYDKLTLTYENVLKQLDEIKSKLKQ